MIKEQKFKKAYAKELLEIAQGDLESARVLLGSKKGRKENVCFIAQQAVEKSIKSVLCFLGTPVPFTHNLDVLIDRIPKNFELKNSKYFNELSEYATIRRYENGNFELDLDDLEASIELATTAVRWAKSIIEPKAKKSKKS